MADNDSTQGIAKFYPMWGTKWLSVTGIGILGAVVLWFTPLAEPDLLRDGYAPINEGEWHKLAAIYVGLILVSHLVIQPTLVVLRRIDRLEDSGLSNYPRSYIVPAVSGAIESILYLTAWLVDSPEFIPFWIAIKVAGGWQVWNQKDSRSRFQVFLVGNAMQLILSGLAYGVIRATVLT